MWNLPLALGNVRQSARGLYPVNNSVKFANGEIELFGHLRVSSMQHKLKYGFLLAVEGQLSLFYTYHTLCTDQIHLILRAMTILQLPLRKHSPLFQIR